MTQNKTIIKCVLTKRLETNRLQDACHKLDSLTVESLWLMVKHRSAEIGRFEVQFSIGARNFLLCPTLMARRNNNYYLSERKTYRLSYSISRHFIVLLHSVIRMNAFDCLVR